MNDPKKNMNACEEFFLDVTDAHILAVVMADYNMSSLDEEPADFLPLKFLDSLQQRAELMKLADEIVSKHVDISFDTAGDNDEDDAEIDNAEGDGDITTYNASDVATNEADGVASSRKDEDHILNYGRDVLTCGLLLKEFNDAIHEGDGTRIFRCWKYFLLIYRATQRKNYAIEAFTLLAQYHYLFSPRMAQQLMWSRTVNIHGQAGKNISCDIHMEQLNRLCKSSLGCLGSNITDQAVDRIGKCIGELVKVNANFDANNKVPLTSGKHSVRSAKKDIEKLLEQLKKNSVFEYQKGRSHAQFKQHAQNVMKRIDLKEHKGWMSKQLTKLILYNN